LALVAHLVQLEVEVILVQTLYSPRLLQPAVAVAVVMVEFLVVMAVLAVAVQSTKPAVQQLQAKVMPVVMVPMARLQIQAAVVVALAQ
jgi:hypothetical protein